METKRAWVVYSLKLRKYYHTIVFNFPDWTADLQRSFWSLSEQNAQSIIEHFNLRNREVRECVIFYPEGSEPFIRLKKSLTN